MRPGVGSARSTLLTGIVNDLEGLAISILRAPRDWTLLSSHRAVREVLAHFLIRYAPIVCITGAIVERLHDAVPGKIRVMNIFRIQCEMRCLMHHYASQRRPSIGSVMICVFSEAEVSDGEGEATGDQGVVQRGYKESAGVCEGEVVGAGDREEVAAVDGSCRAEGDEVGGEISVDQASWLSDSHLSDWLQGVATAPRIRKTWPRQLRD